jgi:hypothetical protein
MLCFQFELVEVRVIRLFFEFGGGCIHYNFTAKSVDDHSANDTTTRLFFSEVNANFRDENDILLCCIVEENDAGTYLQDSFIIISLNVLLYTNMMKVCPNCIHFEQEFPNC